MSSTNPKTKVLTEEEWEEMVVAEALGDALNPDGTIDFDKLRAKGKVVSLEDLYSEEDEDIEKDEEQEL